MGTITDILPRIRLELTDQQKARWQDADLILFISEAVEIVNHLLNKNSIPIGRKEYVFSTVAGQWEYDVPTCFLSPSDLFRTDTNRALTQYTDADWYRVTSVSEGVIWRIFGNKIQIRDTPQSVIPLVLQYWPVVVNTGYTVNTTLPWSGAFDTIIKELVCIRAKNIDESDNLQVNMQLMEAAEKLILASYSSVDAGRATVIGYLEG